ncbi:MAG TPA: NTPase [Thermodesulfobacteriota bacterium]|nr:NTPase [Thermodesulfobacteriota bacterium]
MYSTKKNILITGLPGIGKTTLMKKLSSELKDLNPVGFYTEEIREQGVRKGFGLISLDGRKGLLSHIAIKSPYQVGKYKVDIKGFESFLDSLQFFNLSTGLIVIDEIGKMECLSAKFRKLVEQVLDSDKLVIATIALRGGGIIEKIKKRSDVKLFDMTLSNRDSLLDEILKEVKSVSA